jgi:hypothetical protein
MYIPFVTVIIAAGAPPYLAVLSLAYFSNLSASLTHYGTTPAPIYFGSGYVAQAHVVEDRIDCLTNYDPYLGDFRIHLVANSKTLVGKLERTTWQAIQRLL